VGTGPSSHSSSISRVCFVRCKKFEANFTMALCSFGEVSDQCGATLNMVGSVSMVSSLGKYGQF